MFADSSKTIFLRERAERVLGRALLVSKLDNRKQDAQESINDYYDAICRLCRRIQKKENAKQAVANYHNRLLDGRLMYVSLQQPSSYSTKSSKTASSSNTDNESSTLK